jgi:hypothetical protein
MKRRFESLSLLCASGLLVGALGCSPPEDAVDTTSVQQASGGTPEVRALDDCDPATFGALCRAGFNGGTTLDEFRTELANTQTVGAWKYSSAVNTKPGRPVNVVSRAGETHTFTVVANFGGGKVPSLNTASGNPVAAPECLQASGPRNVTVASGTSQTVTTGAGGTLPVGRYKVQCCIHPWMRTEIEVRN